jgi:cytochrome c2
MLSKGEIRCKFQADLATLSSNMRSDSGSRPVYCCQVQGLDPLFDRRDDTFQGLNPTLSTHGSVAYFDIGKNFAFVRFFRREFDEHGLVPAFQEVPPMRPFLLAIAILICLDQGLMASPLGDAAKTGNAVLVTKLLDEGAAIDEADKFGTALHWATINDHAEVVAVLASRGANLNTNSDLLGTPLHTAAYRNFSGVVLVLLDHGVKIDSLDKEGSTPLQVAAKMGSKDVARILTDAGADVNAISVGQGVDRFTRGERTALHLALQENHLEIARILRSAGAVAGPIVSSSKLLSEASIDSGRELAQIHCKICHAVEGGDDAPTAIGSGPPLGGIAGQPVGRDASFEYTDALREFGGDWTDDRLYTFVLRPMLTVPGTAMGHRLIRKPDEVADIIAYLKSQSH